MKNSQKSKKEINASSMADIAFLLLIFFLVTTTIDQDKGLLNKLPPIDTTDEPQVHKERNVLELNVNYLNQIQAEGKLIAIENLRELTVRHLKNNGADVNLSEMPTKAIVSLKNDRGTSYDIYLQIQNELKAAYNEVRNEEAESLTQGKYNYQALKVCIEDDGQEKKYCQDMKAKIKAKYPMMISEAEPKNVVANR